MKKGRKSITLDDLPPKYREIAEKQLREGNQTGQTASCAPNVGVLTPSEGNDSQPAKRRGKKRREMNATEREFEAYLKREYPDAQGTDYEKHTLRWGEGPSILTYTPDFIVRYGVYLKSESGRDFYYLRLICFEVKGAHAWKQDIVRFKAAVTHFDYLEFQLWEKDGEGRWSNTI